MILRTKFNQKTDSHVFVSDTSPQLNNGLLIEKNIKETSTNQSLLDETFTAAGFYGNAVVALNIVSGELSHVYPLLNTW